jgi:uncharacterized protein YidB (DUF937 family)
MGLFDSIAGGALKDVVGQLEAAAGPTLLAAVLAKTQGGLQGLTEKLQASGLGDQVKSWLGDGANLPITADQLKSVLSSEQVQKIAHEFNLPVDGVLKLLADHLPAAVDKASPNGELEDTKE